MLLTELCEALVTYLNSSPESWGGEEGYEAKAELDPMLCVLPELGLYVTPGVVQYNMQASPGRQKVLSISELLFVSVIVSKRFEELPYDVGVANWEEAKPIVDLRQRAEEYIVGFTHEQVKLAEVEAQPLEELELDNRNFVGVTSFGYEVMSCVSQHELPSSLIASRDATGLRESTVSTRRRLSSGQRLGRR